MIPLRDVIPSRTTPYITITIIVLNALAWLFELMLPHEQLSDFLTAYGVVPAYLAWPTLITSMFLHGSWSHVIGAYFVLYPQSRVLTLIPFIWLQVVELPAVVLLGFWFLMQLFSAGTIAMTAASHGSGGVAFAAHVAGFVMGLIGVFLFKQPERDRWASVDYDRWT